MANKQFLGDFLCGCAFLVVVLTAAASPNNHQKRLLFYGRRLFIKHSERREGGLKGASVALIDNPLKGPFN